MKLILENWNKFLNEEEQPQKCLTVGQLINTIDKMQSEEGSEEVRSKMGKYVSSIAQTLISIIPFGSLVLQGYGIFNLLKQAKNDLKDKKISYDQVSDYPILGTLKIDPELIKVIDDDILKQLDEMYEKDVLKNVEPSTCVNKIETINDFIRRKIKIETDKAVTIIDQSA
tara:strand:+ start:153 stop:662 length:510 start_codon:yes stop_codon:yes gene_type:complete